MPVKVKICGMREPGNIREIAVLRPDYMGFIFYRKSPRYAGTEFFGNEGFQQSAGAVSFQTAARAGTNTAPAGMNAALAGIKKTAVFVDEPLDPAREMINRAGFDAVQLHGNETPAYCRQVKETGAEVIKAFGVGEDFDFSILEAYAPFCDYFMFDAKTSAFGGSGKTFGWELLRRYTGSKPFFLSGGLDLDNLSAALTAVDGLPLYALDLNSRFETAPGLKDTEKVKKAIRLIKQANNDSKE